jgi:hypothetical protein
VGIVLYIYHSGGAMRENEGKSGTKI